VTERTAAKESEPRRGGRLDWIGRAAVDWNQRPIGVPHDAISRSELNVVRVRDPDHREID
jgi:hypothetical protein